MTYGQRSERSERSGMRGVAWFVVGVAIVAALGWWWWSGRGPAALSELGVLPPQSAAGPGSASPTAASPAPPPVAASDAAPAPDSSPEPAPTPDTLPATDSDATSVTGVVAPAEPPSAVESEAADEDKSGVDGVVAISGLPDATAGDTLRAAAIAYPLPALPADRTLEPAGVEPALNQLVQPGAAAKFLQSANFARHFVATVDNLGRSYAPASRWPVNPAPDRFTFEERDGRTYIAPGNDKRYVPLVQLAETLDARAVIDLYVRMYPQLQAAYADLGFPHAYFNDRLIEVMGLLLASPEPSGPIEVEHTRVPNRPAPAKPWANYQFADPALDALTAGQKIMIRVGPDNERRLKSKLAELRQELLTRVLPRQ